jgi:hypothetical protein
MAIHLKSILQVAAGLAAGTWVGWIARGAAGDANPVHDVAIAKITGETRSGTVFIGLVSGQKYAYRIRALGPNELESPWSDEVVCMAPCDFHGNR